MPFDPLKPATPIPLTDEQVAAHVATALAAGIPEDQMRKAIGDAMSKEVWINDTYQVAVFHDTMPAGLGGHAIVHLSIRRLDRAPVRDWRDFQAIKTQLVGPECEAIELYPAESRVVDTANQFHLWCFKDPGLCWPVGFTNGLRLDHNPADKSGSVQRPF